MNVQTELKEIANVLKDLCEKKDEVVKNIEYEFQEKINEMAYEFGKKHNIYIQNVYKPPQKDKYKVLIYFEKEPYFLQTLKHEIFHMKKGLIQTMVEFGNVILYWIN